jgi:dUTP pyrophosphatase
MKTNEEYLQLQLERAEELLEKYARLARVNINNLKVVKKHEDAKLPVRAHAGDAGADCFCVSREFIDHNGNITEWFNLAKQVRYNLGISVEIPEGYVLLLYPRSSVCKKQLIMSNSVGVIDSGYQGEISAIFNITGGTACDIYEAGDRCCQIVLCPIASPDFYWGEFDEETTRNSGGYGSTGA